MTTHGDSRPWRARNLAKIAEARRVLAEARGRTVLRPDAEEGPDEVGGTSPGPEPECLVCSRSLDDRVLVCDDCARTHGWGVEAGSRGGQIPRSPVGAAHRELETGEETR